jgi:DNA-directed RNA polymerase subunit M/transcription elongation factor TFIIS
MGQCATRCPKCGKTWQVDEKFVGKGLQCKGCGTVFRIAPGTGTPAAGKPAEEEKKPSAGGGGKADGPGRPAVKRVACPQCGAIIHIDADAGERVFYCARCKAQVYPPRPGGLGAENKFLWECRKCSHAIPCAAERRGAMEIACDKCGHVNFIPETRVNAAYEAWTAAQKRRARGG